MVRSDRPPAVHIPRSYVPGERNHDIPLCGASPYATGGPTMIEGPGLVTTATCSNCLRIQAHHDRNPLPTPEGF